MKTISVCSLIAGLSLPSILLGQPMEGPDEGVERRGPERRWEGEGGSRRGYQKMFAELWQRSDRDADGVITWEEFSEMPRVKDVPEEKRRHLFNRLDKNGDGKLERRELANIVRGAGAPHMKRLWELDADGSGGVSLEEFRQGRVAGKLPPGTGGAMVPQDGYEWRRRDHTAGSAPPARGAWRAGETGQAFRRTGGRIW